MKKLDDLFLDKLKDYAEKPSDRAWVQINAHLRHRKRKGMYIYFSVAASFAAVLITSVFLYLKNDNFLTETKLADIGTGTAEKAVENIEPEAPEIMDHSFAVAGNQKLPIGGEPTPVQGQSNKAAKKAEALVDDRFVEEADRIAVVLHESDESPTLLMDVSEEGIADETIDREPSVVASVLPPVVITYRRSNINQEPTVTIEAKETTWEKVILLAQGIRNADFGLSDLRQAKDNLLELDLRNRRQDRSD